MRSSFTTQNNCTVRSKLHNPPQVSVPGDALGTTPFILSSLPGTEEFLCLLFSTVFCRNFHFFLSNLDTVILHLRCVSVRFCVQYLHFWFCGLLSNGDLAGSCSLWYNRREHIYIFKGFFPQFLYIFSRSLNFLCNRSVKRDQIDGQGISSLPQIFPIQCLKTAEESQPVLLF